jgi:hypothetical protein
MRPCGGIALKSESNVLLSIVQIRNNAKLIAHLGVRRNMKRVGSIFFRVVRFFSDKVSLECGASCACDSMRDPNLPKPE